MSHAQAKQKVIKALEEKLRLQAEKRQREHALYMQKLRIELLQQVKAGKAAEAIDSMQARDHHCRYSRAHCRCYRSCGPRTMPATRG